MIFELFTLSPYGGKLRERGKQFNLGTAKAFKEAERRRESVCFCSFCLCRLYTKYTVRIEQRMEVVLKFLCGLVSMVTLEVTV